MNDGRRARNLVKKVLRGRRARADVLEALEARGPLPEQHFRIAVYFSDGEVNLYQMRQWYAPLRELSKRYPVLLLARSAGGARALLNESGLDVAFVPRVVDLETIVTEQPLQIVLYVNQNTRNFQMMRYGRRWHVFVNHGESDKMYMTSNQFKTYDYAFVAGDAAKARLSRALWDYDVEKRTIEIGRPQADHFGGDAPYPSDDRMVVLYSPTWEGDRPTATYGSVASHGERLVNALLASGRHRVIYRPHPRSGVVDAEFGAANERIIAAIGAANEADPSAHHIFDQSPSIGWQLALSDVAICDISAMIYDRLATGRPLMVTRPANPEAEVDEQGYLSECEWLTVDDASNAVAVLDRVHGDPDARDHVAQWSTRYFGDTTPGAPTKRFHAAIDTLMDRWEAWNRGEGVIR
nr:MULTISPECIES: CDP-glycerol glycerophosphotransferase family protein [unclassified Leucobacter]